MFEPGEAAKNKLPILLAFWPVFLIASRGGYFGPGSNFGHDRRLNNLTAETQSSQRLNKLNVLRSLRLCGEKILAGNGIKPDISICTLLTQHGIQTKIQRNIWWFISSNFP